MDGKIKASNFSYSVTKEPQKDVRKKGNEILSIDNSAKNSAPQTLRIFFTA